MKTKQAGKYTLSYDFTGDELQAFIDEKQKIAADADKEAEQADSDWPTSAGTRAGKAIRAAINGDIFIKLNIPHCQVNMGTWIFEAHDELYCYYANAQKCKKLGGKKDASIKFWSLETCLKTLQSYGFNYFVNKQRAKSNCVGSCQVCSNGQVVKKLGKYGDFYACSAYPKCTATYRLEGKRLVLKQPK